MAGIIKPKALQKGDKVAVVSPSEPISKEKLDKIIKFFEKLGFKVKPGENVLTSVGDFAAGTPQERAADINRAFADPEIKAIFTTVGGMVASQVLELIDFENIKKNPKIFCGYSDATTLQLAILAKTGLITYHGPNAGSLPDFRGNGYTLTNLWKVLTAPKPSGVVTPQSVWQEIRPGKAEGILFGGNLSCLCKLLGTPYDPIAVLPKIFSAETKYIFFWEEVYEQFSEIMRNLWQVRNTGFLKQVSAMVVGKLTAVAEKDYENFPAKKDLIKELTEPFGIPVLYGVDFGHEVPRATIPIGIKASIDTQAKEIEILEPEVA